MTVNMIANKLATNRQEPASAPILTVLKIAKITLTVACALFWTTLSVGCAKVQQNSVGGAGGGGGSGPVIGMMPPIPNLASLTVSPPTQTVTLTADGTGGFAAMASYTAQATLNDGTSMDVTGKVNWSLDPRTAPVALGGVTVTSPGIYRVIASSGTIMGSAELRANFTGNNFGAGFNQTDAPKLDGAPSGTVAIEYPLNGAIFPSNFGAVTFQMRKTGAQDIARLAFVGDGLDVKHYGVCTPGPPGGGCYVTLPTEITKLFLATSAQHDIMVTARLASVAGGAVAESAVMNLAWANVPLSGGLYYWTTINPGAVPGYTPPDPADPRGTAVMRYNFDGDASKPELVWTDRGSPRSTPPFGGSPPSATGSDPISGRPAWGEGRCIGCHAITPNGKLMAFSINGSDASSWAILNIGDTSLNELDPAASMAVLPNMDALKRYRKGNFATFTTFGPNSDLMVNMYRGKFTMRQVNPTLAMVRDDLFAANTMERKSDPFWSPDPAGKFFAFTSYDLNQEAQDSKYNGDTKTGGQIWVATADPTGPHDDARVIVPRQAGVTSYYPAISNDAAMLVFNKSSCSGQMNPGGYGTGPCDGYDDITASLWLTNPAGSQPVELTAANGGANNSNSWPRWSPDNGGFRGQKLYWLAFSSRRPYGLQVNVGGGAAGKPQLWFSAILLGGEFQGGEPSHAPVWMPKQNLDETNNLPTGNHVPQWVKFAVPIQ